MGQVLVKNPKVTMKLPDGLTRAFWSESSYLMEEDFSFADALADSMHCYHAPFLALDTRLDLLVKRLKARETLTTGFFGVGPLTVVDYLFQTQFKGEVDFTHGEKLLKVLEEYTDSPEILFAENSSLDQALVVDQPQIIADIWERIILGGVLVAASFSAEIPPLPPGKFEALGVLSPIGEPTEFGWSFKGNEGWDLEELSYWKIQKIKD